MKFEVTRGPNAEKISLIVEVEDRKIPLTAKRSFCRHKTCWRVIGYPKSPLIRLSNKKAAKEMGADVVVCPCDGRIIE